MYYLAAFVLLGAFSNSLGCLTNIPCHWKDHQIKPMLDHFDGIANKIINADRSEQSFCQRHSSLQIKEVHTEREYQILVPTYGPGTYDVKVKNRVLLVFSPNCDQSATEIKILPPYVDGYRATWSNMKDGLLITFPYKWDVVNGGGSCADPRKDIGSILQNQCGLGDTGDSCQHLIDQRSRW